MYIPLNMCWGSSVNKQSIGHVHKLSRVYTPQHMPRHLYGFFFFHRRSTCVQCRSLLNWYFEPSDLLGIISGLKETFIKRYTVKRTNKAEIRQEEQSEIPERCRENIWFKIQLKRS